MAKDAVATILQLLEGAVINKPVIPLPPGALTREECRHLKQTADKETRIYYVFPGFGGLNKSTVGSCVLRLDNICYFTNFFHAWAYAASREQTDETHLRIESVLR